MPEDFQEIEVDGVGRFQVPSNYNDAQIKQHISNLRSTKPEIFGGQAALSAQEQAAGAKVANSPRTVGRVTIPDPFPKPNLAPLNVGAIGQYDPGYLAAKQPFANPPGPPLTAADMQYDPKGNIPGESLLQSMARHQTMRARILTADANNAVAAREKMVQWGTEKGGQFGDWLTSDTGNPSAPFRPEARGAVRGITKSIGGMATDPVNLGLLPVGGAMGKVGGRLLSAYFAADMGAGAYHQAKQIQDIWNRPEVSGEVKAEAVSGLAFNTLMAGMALKHASGVRAEIPLAPETRSTLSDEATSSSTQKGFSPTEEPSPTTPLQRQVVGSMEASKADTDFFQQAKKELGEGASISQVAQKAQELKVQGNGSKSAETPVAPLSSPTDLSKLSPEDRHDWINQNVQLRIDANSLEDAQVKAQTMFGGHLSAGKQEVVSYLDKDGKPSFGLKLDYSNPKATPSAAFTEEETPIFGRVQSLESDFTQKTMGKHGEFLNDLWKRVEDTLPKDTPRAGKLSLYEKGLSQAVSSVKKGDLQGLYKSFDVVTQKGEEGFIGPRAARVDPAEASRLSALHVDTQLSKWEGYPDYALAGKKIQKSLSDPTFRNAVYGANAPRLEARYEALSDRAGLAKSNNPIITLGKTLQGVDLTSGDVTRGIFREGLAAKARGAAIRTKQLDSYVKSWDSRPLSDSLQLIDSIEHGDIQSIPNPTDRAMAGQLRAMLDAKRDEVIALGTGKLEQFNANYFPHMWKFGLGDLAKQIMSGRRPLAGGQGFLRARTYDTFSEGIQAGMEPVTYNPVRMSLLKMHEMDRYITAHTAFNELKSKGLVASLSSRDVPVGWARINDQIFNPKPFAVDGATSADAPRVMMTKAYYAPADVARPINNYLSPGLRGNALFDTISSYNNILNQFNLSLSLFHGVETGINAAVSKSALGLGQIQQGKLLTGVKNILAGPVEPLAAYLRGNKLLQEYLDPGSYAKMSKEAIALEMAGGRISMPMEWKNQASEAFRNAWKEAADAPNLSLKQVGKVGLGVYRTLGVALEKASTPIMEYYVPRVKLGVFADMAKDVLDRVGPNVSHEVLRHELGKAWDSVDNRFGQVVYDNWFWNRTFKDIGHLAVRSVGWNLGTAQEVGAVWDVKTQLQTGFKGGLTRKQLYTLSLLGYTAMMGATLSHLYGQQPDDLTYMGYAKTGKKNPDGSDERIFVKTYINDIYSFYHAPGQTASNKLAPIWSQVSQLYNNADYFGRQIHPIHASTTDALTDPDSYTSTGKYLLKSTFPFSVTNMQQRMASGESVWQAASSSMAILQAPKWVGQTKAQSLAYEFYRTKLPRGPGDPDVADRIQRYHQLATGYSAGNFSDKDVEKAFQEGEITPKQFHNILGSSDKNFQDSDGKLSILLRHTKVLPAHEFIRVFEAGTPQEKRDLEIQLLQKTSTLLENYPEREANKLLVRFDKAYKSIPR